MIHFTGSFSLTPLPFPLSSRGEEQPLGEMLDAAPPPPPGSAGSPPSAAGTAGTFLWERRRSQGETFLPDPCGKPWGRRGLGRRVESYEVIRVSSGPSLLLPPPPPPASPHYAAKFSTNLLINLPGSRARKIIN